MQVKEEYDKLLESGELFELFPGAKGEWKKDKQDFIEIYNINNEIIDDYESNR